MNKLQIALGESAMITEDVLALMHETEQAWDKRQKFCLNYSRALDPRRVLARQVERIVRDRLAERYIVTKTAHMENYDLLAQGVRIEVKASRWDGRRYEANMRDNQADALVFGCVDGELHFFVIPFDQVIGRTVIKVSSHDPREYLGQWMRWYDAWDVIDEMIASGHNSWQLPLLDESHPC